MRTYFKIFLPWSFFLGLGIAVWVSNSSGHEASGSAGEPTGQAGTQAADKQVHMDPVCHMEVTPAWGFHARHDGHDWYFCTKHCREEFEASPNEFLGDRCVVCGELNGEDAVTATYLEKSYRLCGDDHRREFKADPASFFMHTMWGIEPWMYYLSISLVLVVSFGTFEWLERLLGARSQFVAELPVVTSDPIANSDRIDLLQSGFLKAAATSRVLRFVIQAIVVVLFFAILAGA